MYAKLGDGTRIYLPYVKMYAKEDSIGNLELWLANGNFRHRPQDDSKVAYIQTSQERASLFSWCFGLEQSDIDDLEHGWTVELNVHEEIAQELFC
jgi:hypothetical protein